MKNIDIANTHRLYRKFVGHTVALSGLLAFVINAMSVASGVIVIALVSTSSSGWIAQCVATIIAGIIGAFLAVLADGMTLSACARLRVSLEKIALIRENYSRIPDNEKADAIKHLEKQELKSHKHTARINCLSIAFFVTISCAAGTLFWHKLLESLPEWQAWSFSTLFSLLVSGTLIACELYKQTNNEIIRESIVADHFSNEALLEDANERALKLLHDKYKIEIEQIAQNTDTIKYAIEEHAVSVYDNLLAGGKGLIPQRIHREKVDKQVQIEMEKNQIKQQLLLIRGGKETVANMPALEEEPVPVIEQPVTTEARVRAARLTYPDKSVRELATLLNLSPTTVHKYIKNAVPVNGTPNGDEVI